jgi:hypothetical protein
MFMTPHASTTKTVTFKLAEEKPSNLVVEAPKTAKQSILEQVKSSM